MKKLLLIIVISTLITLNLSSAIAQTEVEPITKDEEATSTYPEFPTDEIIDKETLIGLIPTTVIGLALIGVGLYLRKRMAK